jgi:hypothetical protein
MVNNTQMVLYSPGCIDNNIEMKLYSTGGMENNLKKRSCITLDVWKMTNK